MASARDAALTRSFICARCKFCAWISAWSPFHSILPSQVGAGGCAGMVFPMSYMQLFWLLEPELSTRIFMA